MLNQMLMKFHDNRHEIKEKKKKLKSQEKGLFDFVSELLNGFNKKGIIPVRLLKSLKAYLNERD